MPPDTLQLKPRYTRSDPKGQIPAATHLAEAGTNRLYPFWRPIVDMTDSPFASTRLRTIAPAADWLADPDTARPLWFARVNVAGLRHQVIRHSGLREHDAKTPYDLKEDLRTPAWRTLIEAMEGYGKLDDHRRSLVVFLLGQLSYCVSAVRLAGEVEPGGDRAHHWYAYQVARVDARLPGHRPRVLPLFEQLGTQQQDRQLALLSCFQGISHALRKERDIPLARWFEETGRAITGLPDDWHTGLVRSRFHRALALLRLHEGRPAEMRSELAAAFTAHEQACRGLTDGIDLMVAAENRRILLESRINAAGRARGSESAEEIAAVCEEILGIDPYCALVRLAAGDGYLAAGRYETAAHWYAQAGELGSGAGAIGWYRAGQVFDFLGDTAGALNAMGHCLELDATAIEPRRRLERR